MEAFDFNYFYKFECEYEAIKGTTTDILALSYKMIEFIQEKLKEIGKWLKKTPIYFSSRRNTIL
jgi:hypothetical protein